MFTFLSISLAFCAKLSWCYEDGAPPVSCNTMTPGHIHPIEHNRISGLDISTSPYNLHAKWNHQRNLIQVSITGDVLQGFLIQGRISQGISQGRSAVGEFVNVNETDVAYQDCRFTFPKFEPKSSLTHTNKNEKKNLIFYWKPPVNQTGTVTFLATLCKTKLNFWVKQKSNPVFLTMTEIIPETTPEMASTPTMASTPNSSSSAGSKTASAIIALRSIILVIASLVLLS